MDMFSTLRCRLSWLGAVFLCAVLGAGGLSPAPVWAIPAKAGMVIAVSQGAMAESKQGTRVLKLQSPIFVGDVIRTDATGSVQILFHDDSILAIDEDGEVAVNRFVYSGTDSSASEPGQAAGSSDADGKSSASGASGSGRESADTSSASAENGAAGQSGEASASARESSGTGGTEGTSGANRPSDSSALASTSSEMSGTAGANGTDHTSNSSASTNAPLGTSGGSDASAGLNGMGGNPNTSAGMGGMGGPIDPSSSADMGGDGLSVTIVEGTAMFSSGYVCNQNCDVVTLAGAAGVGGRDHFEQFKRDHDITLQAVFDDPRDHVMHGTLLAVTASAKNMTSEISVLALSQDMLVTVAGKGLAAQTLAQGSLVKFGDGMASVAKLDAGITQARMGAAAAPAAAAALGTKNTLESASLQGRALGGSPATPQAKAVGTASTSARMNNFLDANSTLTRLDTASTVDFTGNTMLQYSSVATVTYNDGANAGEIQLKLFMDQPTTLGANMLEAGLAGNGMKTETTITKTTAGNLAAAASNLESQIKNANSGLAKAIKDSSPGAKGKGKF